MCSSGLSPHFLLLLHLTSLSNTFASWRMRSWKHPAVWNVCCWCHSSAEVLKEGFITPDRMHWTNKVQLGLLYFDNLTVFRRKFFTYLYFLGGRISGHMKQMNPVKSWDEQLVAPLKKRLNFRWVLLFCRSYFWFVLLILNVSWTSTLLANFGLSDSWFHQSLDSKASHAGH